MGSVVKMRRVDNDFYCNVTDGGIITQSNKLDGTEGRTRTDTELPQLDFESNASTNFATPARGPMINKFSMCCHPPCQLVSQGD